MQSKEDRKVVLSEEEMKEIKETLEYRDIERLKGLCKNKGIQRFEGKQLIALENLIKDYEQLKLKKQKLIEKLKEKDKIIDLMAEELDASDYCVPGDCPGIDCKEHVKEYYRKMAKKGNNIKDNTICK